MDMEITTFIIKLTTKTTVYFITKPSDGKDSLKFSEWLREYG